MNPRKRKIRLKLVEMGLLEPETAEEVKADFERIQRLKATGDLSETDIDFDKAVQRTQKMLAEEVGRTH